MQIFSPQIYQWNGNFKIVGTLLLFYFTSSGRAVRLIGERVVASSRSVRVRLAMHCCQTRWSLVTTCHSVCCLLSFELSFSASRDRFVRYIVYLTNFEWSFGNCYCLLLLLISVVILLLLLTLNNWCFIWCVVIPDNP